MGPLLTGIRLLSLAYDLALCPWATPSSDPPSTSWQLSPFFILTFQVWPDPVPFPVIWEQNPVSHHLGSDSPLPRKAHSFSIVKAIWVHGPKCHSGPPGSFLHARCSVTLMHPNERGVPNLPILPGAAASSTWLVLLILPVQEASAGSGLRPGFLLSPDLPGDSSGEGL